MASAATIDAALTDFKYMIGWKSHGVADRMIPKSCSLFKQDGAVNREHDPENLQTFRTRSRLVKK
jgi:hypothetical protein